MKNSLLATRNSLLIAFLATLLISSCNSTKEVSQNNSTIPANNLEQVYKVTDSLIVIEDALHFLAIGDWGRKGDYHQQDVADRMEEAAKTLDAEFIISLGDHFYPDGVASVDDPNWMFSFENIYKGYHLNVPWYAVLGNHGYRGSAQAQVDYTHKSRRWMMPARYYDYDFYDDDTDLKVNFLFLDTTPFEKKYFQEKKYSGVWDQDSKKQEKWIDSVMQNKRKADWVIFSGHHPLYSGGKRLNDTKEIREAIGPILERHNVDIYFAGHEHDLQYIKPKGKTHHFISGGGSEIRKTGLIEGLSKFAASVQGFMAVSITKEQILVQVINYKGNIIYTTKILKKEE